jgi:miniconductance mechanosensitive channel
MMLAFAPQSLPDAASDTIAVVTGGAFESASQIHPLLAPLEGWILANPLTAAAVVALSVLLFGEVLHRIFRRWVLRFLQYVAERSPVNWDNVLFETRMPHRLAWGVPLLVWYTGVVLVPGLPGDVELVLRRILLASMIVVIVRAFDAFLEGINKIYQALPRAHERPIKGFLQVANVVAHLGGLIWVVAIIMDRSPVIFLSGLGAMTAVLLLVFRDTLLSLVAGIQLTTNDLIRVGDWIEMPQFSADGDVTDVALNSITVQNWDRTLTVIPTHKFLEHSFKNWRGMSDSGGRRIKRSLHLDLASVRFLTGEEVARFERWELLRDYVRTKREEVERHNREHPPEDGVEMPHHRRMTNLGTFRAYLVEYLRSHPGIRQDMIMIVRQLEPGPDGIPMEIYAFTSDIRWVQYEGIQGDIFDHVLAMVPEFGLRVFQQPSGADLERGLARSIASGAGTAGSPVGPAAPHGSGLEPASDGSGTEGNGRGSP